MALAGGKEEIACLMGSWGVPPFRRSSHPGIRLPPSGFHYAPITSPNEPSICCSGWSAELPGPQLPMGLPALPRRRFRRPSRTRSVCSVADFTVPKSRRDRVYYCPNALRHTFALAWTLRSAGPTLRLSPGTMRKVKRSACIRHREMARPRPIRAVSSIGRASRLHREGHRFESCTAHPSTFHRITHNPTRR